MTIDIVNLKALAEAATPGRVHDRLDSCGGGLKYTCNGDDGSLVLQVDHKNDKFGFIGPNHSADEAFFLTCTPAAVLDLLSEIESLSKDLESHKRMLLSAAVSIGTIGEALGAEMDDDPSELEGLAAELRKDADRYRWLRENHILAHVQVAQRDGTEPYVYAEELDRSVDDILAAIADKKTGD